MTELGGCIHQGFRVDPNYSVNVVSEKKEVLLDTYMIVVLTLELNPSVPDSRKRGSSVSVGVAVRDGLRGPLCRVENTWVGQVEVLGLRYRPLSKAVTSMRGNHGEYVSPNVPSSECEESPTRLLVGARGKGCRPFLTS
jgi:hypothetical protein